MLLNEIFETDNVPTKKAILLYKLRNYEIQQRIYHLYKKLKRMNGFKELYLVGSSISNADYFADVDLVCTTNRKRLFDFENFIDSYHEKYENPKENIVRKNELATFDIQIMTNKPNSPRIQITQLEKPKLLYIGKSPLNKQRLNNAVSDFADNIKMIKEILNEGNYSQKYLEIYQFLMLLYKDYYEILKLLYKNAGFAIPYFEEDAIKLSKKFVPQNFVNIGLALMKANRDIYLDDKSFVHGKDNLSLPEKQATKVVKSVLNTLVALSKSELNKKY